MAVRQTFYIIWLVCGSY